MKSKKSIWLGGVLAGLVVFAWGFVSWMALGFHEASMKNFKDETAVKAAIEANISGPGIYVFPNGHAGTEGMSAEQKKAKQDAAMKQWQTGTSAFVSVNTSRPANMGICMGIGLVICLISGLIVAWMLSKTTGLKYWHKVGFVTLIGVTVALLSSGAYWNWWGFSASYIFAEVLDHVAAWYLAGLVLAKFSK